MLLLFKRNKMQTLLFVKKLRYAVILLIQHHSIVLH